MEKSDNRSFKTIMIILAVTAVLLLLKVAVGYLEPSEEPDKNARAFAKALLTGDKAAMKKLAEPSLYKKIEHQKPFIKADTFRDKVLQKDLIVESENMHRTSFLYYERGKQYLIGIFQKRKGKKWKTYKYKHYTRNVAPETHSQKTDTTEHKHELDQNPGHKHHNHK